MNHPGHIVVLGAGHAGGRVAQHLRSLDAGLRITLVGDEAHAPYERPALSKQLLLGTMTAPELTLAPAAFWSDAANVERVIGRAHRVDGNARTVTLEDGAVLAFDQLVVATGGRTRRLASADASTMPVHYLRTLDDCLALRAVLGSARRLVIVGAGVIGMEAAASATALGCDVSVLEAGERVMARCLPPTASAWIAGLHRAQGVRIDTAVQIAAIDGAGVHCTLASGADVTIGADVVLVAIGITPDTAFLDGAGVALDDGVLVDAFCRSTTAPWCYAVGDVANTYSALYGRHLRQETWRNAENQARAVAEIILGRTTPYAEVPWMWTDQFGRNLQVVGVPAAGDVEVPRTALGAGPGALPWLRNGQVAGGVLLDQGRDRRYLEALVRSMASVDPAVLGDPAVPLKQVA